MNWKWLGTAIGLFIAGVGAFGLTQAEGDVAMLLRVGQIIVGLWMALDAYRGRRPWWDKSARSETTSQEPHLASSEADRRA